MRNICLIIEKEFIYIKDKNEMSNITGLAKSLPCNVIPFVLVP